MDENGIILVVTVVGAGLVPNNSYIYIVRINRSVQHFYIKALSLAAFQRSSPTDKSACTQQVVTFHGSGAQQQLTWKHSGIAQQQTELLGNSPKQQRDAQQERRA